MRGYRVPFPKHPQRAWKSSPQTPRCRCILPRPSPGHLQDRCTLSTELPRRAKFCPEIRAAACGDGEIDDVSPFGDGSSPTRPFLESSQPQLSKSPMLQFLVRVYMTPAELMACTKDVSRVAGGEGKKAVTCKHRHQSWFIGNEDVPRCKGARRRKRKNSLCKR